MKRVVLCLTVLLLVGATTVLSVLAQVGAPFVAIANSGADGPFAPADDVAVDLAQAETAVWDAAPTVPGAGVYDGEKWAVVFKYSSVEIPSGVTVSFANHPARAPVVWLVSGDVVINGTIDLSGDWFSSGRVYPEPGPGGFRGGSSANPGSSGFGPGGSLSAAVAAPAVKAGASYGTNGGGSEEFLGPTYGTPGILPLIGGSGGSGVIGGVAAGGAGGGAILIVAESITVNGSVLSEGGRSRLQGSDGSGGAIRLVARTVGGGGTLVARGPVATNELVKGGAGRIRLESESPIGANLQTDPPASTGAPSDPVAIWPPASAPTARIVSIGGAPVPADPRANLSHTPDVELPSGEDLEIVVETTGVAVDPDTVVEIRITPREGPAFLVEAEHTSGDTRLSTWTASGVTLSQTVSAVQVVVQTP